MLDIDAIQSARGEAARSGRKPLDVLEERCGLAPAEFVARLADALGYRAATMADLERAASARAARTVSGEKTGVIAGPPPAPGWACT